MTEETLKMTLIRSPTFTTLCPRTKMTIPDTHTHTNRGKRKWNICNQINL